MVMTCESCVCVRARAYDRLVFIHTALHAFCGSLFPDSGGALSWRRLQAVMEEPPPKRNPEWKVVHKTRIAIRDTPNPKGRMIGSAPQDSRRMRDLPNLHVQVAQLARQARIRVRS